MNDNIAISTCQARFNHVNKEIIDIYHDVSTCFQMSHSMFEIFYSIFELGEGCRQKDICNVCFLSKQTVHSAIRKMEEEGYLTLVSGKGHEKQIYLTEKGQHFTEKNLMPIIQSENDTFYHMEEEKRQVLLKYLEEYTSELKKTMLALIAQRKEASKYDPVV